MTDEEFVELGDELALYAGDPTAFVENMFDWSAPDLAGKSIEPWQREVLDAIRDGLPLGKAVRLAIVIRAWRWQNLPCELDSSMGNEYTRGLSWTIDREQRSAAGDS